MGTFGFNCILKTHYEHTLYLAQPTVWTYTVPCTADSLNIHCTLHSRQSEHTLYLAQPTVWTHTVPCTAGSLNIHCTLYSRQSEHTLYLAQPTVWTYTVPCTADSLNTHRSSAYICMNEQHKGSTASHHNYIYTRFIACYMFHFVKIHPREIKNA